MENYLLMESPKNLIKNVLTPKGTSGIGMIMLEIFEKVDWNL